MDAIIVDNLRRRFGPTWALDGVSFRVGRDEVVGFLGPNGAGKSTTMRILTGLLSATSGTASVAGIDVRANPLVLRTRIGFLPERLAFYDEMRVGEYLAYRARLKGLGRAARAARIGEVAERCGLSPVQRRVVGQLSKGFRQRVGLADALLADPEILILDEPTVGLDPLQIRELRRLIRELGERRTVLLSSHILSEVEAVCPRVIIIHGGRVVAEGTPRELTRQLPGANQLVVEVRAPDEAALEGCLIGLPTVAEVRVGRRPGADDGLLRARVTGAADAPRLGETIHAALAETGWPVSELYRDPPHLEELFVELTRGGWRPEPPSEPGTAPAPPAPSTEARPTASRAADASAPDALAARATRPGRALLRTFATQLRRELGTHFLTPSAWILITTFLVLSGCSFVLYLTAFHGHIGALTEHFFNFVFFWFLILFLPPVLTMRTFAEERRSGRIDLLLSAPTTPGGILLAKYVAAVLLFALLWGLTGGFFLAVELMARSPTAPRPLDWGPIAAGYLGTLSLGAMLLALTLLASLTARDQLVAAVLGIIATLSVFFLGWLTFSIKDPQLRELFTTYHLYRQFALYSRGLIDSRVLIFNLTFTAALLAIAHRLLSIRRWL